MNRGWFQKLCERKPQHCDYCGELTTNGDELEVECDACRSVVNWGSDDEREAALFILRNEVDRESWVKLRDKLVKEKEKREKRVKDRLKKYFV